MAGRKPTSNKLKELKGTNQPSRMREELDLGTITKVPPPPKYFNKYAKREYKNVATKLIAQNILNEVNVVLVAAYANEIGKYYAAEEELSKDASRVITQHSAQSSKEVRNPLDRMATEYLDNAKRLAIELGITPASSSKIKAPDQPKKNPLADYF